MSKLIYPYIYLYLIQKLSKERTINSIYHLLQGKKSVQTIQDAHLFDLEAFYAIDKKLTKQNFEAILLKLQQKKLIAKQDETDYQVTKKGQLWLESNQEIASQIYLNGWMHQKTANEFFKRLQLIIQIWTNKYKNNMKFIPVIEEYSVKIWAREIYQLTQDKVETYLLSIHNELSGILNHFENKAATIFVKQLSSYKYTGMTIEQLAIENQIEPVEVLLQTENIVHFILNELSKEDLYPVLNLLCVNIVSFEQTKLNESTMQTMRLFNQGYAMKDIIQRRGLKQSTIQDHLIEIAYSTADFPFNQFFNQAQYELVKKIIAQIQSYQLKKIKALAEDALTYFQIRLIIAAIHHNK